MGIATAVVTLMSPSTVVFVVYKVLCPTTSTALVGSSDLDMIHMVSTYV